MPIRCALYLLCLVVLIDLDTGFTYRVCTKFLVEIGISRNEDTRLLEAGVLLPPCGKAANFRDRA